MAEKAQLLFSIGGGPLFDFSDSFLERALAQQVFSRDFLLRYCFSRATFSGGISSRFQ